MRKCFFLLGFHAFTAETIFMNRVINRYGTEIEETTKDIIDFFFANSYISVSEAVVKS